MTDEPIKLPTMPNLHTLPFHAPHHLTSALFKAAKSHMKSFARRKKRSHGKRIKWY